ncbi:hypothetical protein AB0K15_27690 [Amycolatopsis sp. NPDC049253]|uniref:hypothetical protein n=1 Tax=Amycolatopsis sp. NPDC049253 TaxID=3155274 RepID=UPI0034172961
MYPIEPDETVLWTGRPERYCWRYRDYHWFVVVLVVIVVGVVLTSILAAPEYGVPVMAVVVSGSVGSAIARHRERASRVGATTYVVTDRRLVFATYWPQGAEFRWIPLAYLRRPRVRDIGGGLGIVDFRPTVAQWLKDQGYRPRPVWYPKLPELMGIRDAQEVAELISRNAGHSSVLG